MNHGESRDYETELAAFAERLRELRLGCNQPSYRVIEKAAGTEVPLPIATVSEVLSAKRLPKLDFLVRLVQVLYGHADGRPVGRDDPRVQVWHEPWRELTRLQTHHRTERRRETARIGARGAFGTGAGTGFVVPPDDATIPQLEAAREGLQGVLADITEQQRQASQELLAAFDVRANIEIEIARLKRLETQQHKQVLVEKITALEEEQAELTHRIAELRQELQELQEDQLDITEEESVLNARRATHYFDWARSEEAERVAAIEPLTDRVRRLTAMLADRDRKLAAADLLITSLRTPREHP